MRPVVLLSALALLAQPLAAFAADAPAKPLRQLVYDVTYSAHSVHTKKTSGFNGGYGNDMGAARDRHRETARRASRSTPTTPDA